MSISAKDHAGPDDLRLIVKFAYPPDLVLEGARWDGSDLISSHSNITFISKRMFDWIVSVHAGPLMARPVKFCTDGMSHEQKRWLEEIADVSTVEF
jgi:hypothetical protein